MAQDKSLFRWIAEYNFDQEAAVRIIRVLDSNPVSLSRCADILEVVARMCEDRVMPMYDAAKYLMLGRTEINGEVPHEPG